jgi:hypothetical protein
VKRSVIRYWAIILCLAFLPAGAAFAQKPGDPATKEDVQKLFDVMHSRKQFDAIMDTLKQQIPGLTKSTLQKQLPNATAEETAQLNAFVKDATEKMFQNMPFDELMQAMMPAYQHHFTHGELQELIQFYSTPLGQKLLTEMPAILAEYMQAAAPVIQKWTKAQMADLKASSEAYAKKMKEANNPNDEQTPPAAHSHPIHSIPASLTRPLNSIVP